MPSRRTIKQRRSRRLRNDIYIMYHIRPLNDTESRSFDCEHTLRKHHALIRNEVSLPSKEGSFLSSEISETFMSESGQLHLHLRPLGTKMVKFAFLSLQCFRNVSTMTRKDVEGMEISKHRSPVKADILDETIGRHRTYVSQFSNKKKQWTMRSR